MGLNNKILHIFNSSIISGPEMLVIPNLKDLKTPASVLFLTEKRKAGSGAALISFAKSFGLTVYEIPVRSRFDLKAILALRKLLQEKEFTLLHAHDVKASTYSFFATLFMPIAKISTHHGVHGRPDLKSKFYELFYGTLILKAFSQVIAVSSEDYKTLLHRGIKKTKLSCAWNGITRRKIQWQEREALREAIQKKWGLSQNISQKCVLAVVGRISAEKACERILLVAKELQVMNCATPWCLLFIGTGPLLEELQQKTITLALESTVQWLGYRNTIAEEFSAIDILVNLSPAEGQPISILEAAWANTSIFAGAVGGIKDIIPNESFGKTISLSANNTTIATQLKQWIESPAARKESSQLLQKRVEDAFSASVWSKKQEEIYLNLLSEV